jgi:hypothetical protein
MYCDNKEKDFVEKNSDLKMTLPFVSKPFRNESLYGYSIRLDIINNYPLGTTLKLINYHKTGRLLLNRPGLFITGKTFNFKKLSEVTNISIEELNNLTFSPSLYRIYNSQRIYPESLTYSKSFKICPSCVTNNLHPLLFLLEDIAYCQYHNVQLYNKCICGEKILLFYADTKANYCPNCGFPYRSLKLIPIDNKSKEFQKKEYYFNAYKDILFNHINLVHDGEQINNGLEKRLNYLIYENKIKHSDFKYLFGYNISNAKNGHGLSNLSISSIIHALYKLNISVTEFRDLHINTKVNKITNIYPAINEKSTQHTCPNIYCSDFNLISLGNIKYYGKRIINSGIVKIEEFCSTCGTRFIDNNIIQSYDYNPGLRQYDIEKARCRIIAWQQDLKKVCEEMIQCRIPITLTGCFKKAGIPIGKTYFIDRLGLINILEEYARKQIEDSLCWLHELPEKDAASFLRRIYKHKKKEC